MAKFKPERDHQLLLLPPSLEELIPQEHLSRLVLKIVAGLNTKPIEDKYSSLGQHTYHPKILLKILFYGYATGVRSGRKLAQKCETDTAFMYLAQMYRPDFRTINDFRKNNLDQIETLFVEIVRICQSMSFTQVGTLLIDSSKIGANASPKKSKTEKEYQEWLEDVEKKIKDILEEAEKTDAEEDKLYGDKRGDELPEEINTPEKLKKRIEEVMEGFENEKEQKKRDKKKINSTDPEAPFMKERNGVIKPAYNCQVSVTENQIIAGADVTTSPNDIDELISLIEQTEENTNKKAKRIIADRGYGTYHNYEYLQEKKKDGYIPDLYFNSRMNQTKQEEENLFGQDSFIYDKENNCYICPEKKRLEFKTKRISNRQRKKQLIYQGTNCPSCQAKTPCTKQKYKIIAREMRQELRDEMRKKLLTEEGRSIYKKRLYTVEPIFGHFKYNLGYKNFLLRSLRKTRAEFKLMCIGYNLTKIWRYGPALAAK